MRRIRLPLAGSSRSSPSRALIRCRHPRRRGVRRKRRRQRIAPPQRPHAPSRNRSARARHAARPADRARRQARALVVRRPDFAKNKYRNELVLVDARTGTARTLVHERDDVNEARWSPARRPRRVRRDAAERPRRQGRAAAQLYVLRLDGGEPARDHRGEERRRVVRLASRRPRFAYVARDESPDAKRIEDARRLVRGHRQRVDVALEPRARSTLWTVDADGKQRAPRHARHVVARRRARVRAGRPPRVRRRARRTHRRNHYRARSIVAIDLAERRVREIARNAHAAPTARRSSPGGKRARSTAASTRRRSRRASSSSRTPTAATRATSDRAARPQHPVRHLRAARRHRRRRERRHARPPVRARPERRAARAAARRRRPPAAPRRRATARSRSSASTPAHPPELYVLHAPQKAAAPATSNRSASRTTTTPSPRTRWAPRARSPWRSADGFRRRRRADRTAGAAPRGKKYPLVVLIHGGPTATSPKVSARSRN